MGSLMKQRLNKTCPYLFDLFRWSLPWIYCLARPEKNTQNHSLKLQKNHISLQKVIGEPPALKWQGVKKTKQKIWAFFNIFEQDTLRKIVSLKRINFNFLFKIWEKKVEIIKIQVLKFQPVNNLIWNSSASYKVSQNLHGQLGCTINSWWKFHWKQMFCPRYWRYLDFVGVSNKVLMNFSRATISNWIFIRNVTLKISKLLEFCTEHNIYISYIYKYIYILR